MLDRKGGAASCVSVGLREDDARYIKRFVKTFRNRDCVLTRHRIDGEQNLVRLDSRFDIFQLVHEDFVDVQTTRGVKKNDVVSVIFCVGNGAFRYLNGICSFGLCENGDPEFIAENLQLQDRGRSVNVTRDE